MPRTHAEVEPQVINEIVGPALALPRFEFATHNQDKLSEIRRILVLNEDQVIGKDLKVDEIQSENPEEVVSKKAIQAWMKNGYNPIIVEDTSLSFFALDNLPGPYADAWTNTPVKRKRLLKMMETEPDRRAVAQVLLAEYDGKEVHIRKGLTTGTVPYESRGTKGFGWDDIFIPDGQPDGQQKTFAEMEPEEKDAYSVRRKALEDMRQHPFKLGKYIQGLPEPYEEEINLIRLNEFTQNARQFAFNLEALGPENNVNNQLQATQYHPVAEEQNGDYYTRYTSNPESASLGLILTNIDKDRIKRYKNGDPIVWQMGPERRTLALAQRALYFDRNQNEEIYNTIRRLESGEQPIRSRSNRRHAALDEALGIRILDRLPKGVAKFIREHGWIKEVVTKTPAFTEIGYRKIHADKEMSRRLISQTDLFNKIGKYPRRIIGLGSMPPVTGWKDSLVTAAVGHMVSFIPRNSIFASDVDRQIKLFKQAEATINALPISDENKPRVLRNIGASIGCENVEQEMENVTKLYDEGVRLFRIYTINADPRVVEMARSMRSKFGDEIEIFVGQVADKEQARQLIADDIRADALIYGHGGGRQCTSAINGMAITSVEDIYDVVRDSDFNKTTILAEGGVDKSVGVALAMGIDGVLYNQKLVHGAIEVGDLFVEDKKGNIVQPYPGDASPVTQKIESANPKLRERRTDAAGRTHTPEGKPGFMYYEEKGNSMAFWVNEFLTFAARTMADLGVDNLDEMRKLLENEDSEILRLLSSQTTYKSDAYRNG